MSEPQDKPNFDTCGLEFTGDTVVIGVTDGVENVWIRTWWDTNFSRVLRRNVPAGLAEISECRGSGGNFTLKIKIQPEVERLEIEATLFFETLLAAAEAAEVFEWKIKEQGGYKWYQTTCRDNYSAWHAVVCVGDRAQVSCNKEGEYHMKREISPRSGEWYEISAHRHSYGDEKHAITTFAEAAAIAITLPSFLAVLGARQS